MIPIDNQNQTDEREESVYQRFARERAQREQNEQALFRLRLQATDPNSLEQLRVRSERARELGVPVAYVEAIGDDEANRRLFRQRVQADTIETPYTMRFLTDAAQQHRMADTSYLRQGETILGSIGGRGIGKGSYIRQRNNFGYRAATNPDSITEDDLTQLQIAEYELRKLQNTASELNPAEHTINIVTYLGTNLTSAVPNAFKRAGAGAAIGAAISMTPWGKGKKAFDTVTKGAKTGASAGFTAGFIEDSFQQGVGEAFLEYSEMLDENGRPLDPKLARGGAYFAGAIMAGFDVIPAGRLLGAVPGLEGLTSKMRTRQANDAVRQLLGSPQGRGFLEKLGDLSLESSKTAFLEGVTEAAQELTLIAVGEERKVEATAQGLNVDFDTISLGETVERIAQAGFVGTIGGAGLRVAISPLRVPSEIIQKRFYERNAETDQQRVDRLDATVSALSESSMADSPQDTETFVNGALDEAGDPEAKTVHIDAKTLAQTAEDNDIDANELLDRLRVTQEQREQAQQTNGDVEVSVGALVAEAVAQEKKNPGLRKELMDIVRYNPQSFSRRELNNWRKMTPEQQNKELQPFLKRAFKQEQTRKDAESVQQRVFEQLTKAGRHGKSVNREYAAMTALQYMVLGQRLGLTPTQTFERYPVTITGVKVGGQQAFGQVVYRARKDGYKGFDPADSIEWNEAREKGLDLSEEARFKRAKDQGYNVNLPLYRGYSRANVFAGKSKNLKGEFKDMRDMRPLGKHRHIFFSEEQDFAVDFGDFSADAMLPENDPNTGLPWEKQARDEALAIATDNTVFKMYLRGKILDLSDPAQGPIFEKELEQLLEQDEQALRDTLDGFIDALFSDIIPESLFENYLTSIQKTIKDSKNTFAKEELSIGLRQFKKTKDKNTLRKDVQKALFYYLGGSDQYVGSIKEDTFYRDKDHNKKPYKDTRLPLVQQLLFSNATATKELSVLSKWRKDKDFEMFLEKIEEGHAAINQLVTATSAFVSAHNGRETTLANKYRPAFFGMKDHYLTKWQISTGGNAAERFDQDDNFWEVVEIQASHYVEAAGYAAYKMKEFGQVTYGVVDYRNVRSPLGAFDPEYVGVSGNIYAQQIEGAKERRGEYVPELSEVRLLEKANLTTFTHEMGHHWLEVHNKIALELNDRVKDIKPLLGGEQQLLNDFNTLVVELARQTNQTITEGQTPTEWFSSLTFEQRESMHELFAQMSEAYFFDGKPPVPELKNLFRTFARWIVNAYRNIRPDVQLTKEVRQVFDRMHAAQEDIDFAQDEQLLNPMFNEKPPMMSDAEWQRYQELNQEAEQTALEKLRERTLRNMKWLENAKSKHLSKMQREARDQRRVVRAQVEEAVRQRKVYNTIRFLRTGKTYNGIEVTGPHKLDAELLPEIMGAKSTAWKRLGYGKNGMLGKGKNALDPRTLASMLNYSSPKTMVNAILRAEDINAVIERETDQAMIDRFGDLVDPQAHEAAANDAVMNKFRERVLRAEFAALNEMLGKTTRYQTRLFTAEGRNAAEMLVARMTLRDLNVNRYIFAAQRAGRKAEKALMEDNLEAAAAAKRDQLLNFMLVQEVQKTIKMRDKAFTLFKTVRKGKKDKLSKTRDYNRVMMARAVLALYGLATPKQTDDIQKYLGMVAEYDPAIYQSLVEQAATVINDAKPGSDVRDLSVDDFRSLYEIVEGFWQTSREVKQIERAGKRLEFDEVKTQVVDLLTTRGAELPPDRPTTVEASDAEKKQRSRGSLITSYNRMENWVRTADGLLGRAMRETFFQEVSQSADRLRRDRLNIINPYIERFEKHAKKFTNDPVEAPELEFTFPTKVELLMALLHTGNPSNKRKLLLGYQWATETDGVLDTSSWDRFVERAINEEILTKDDFDFLQDTWDVFEQMKPGAQKAHKRLYGRYFDQVTHESFTNAFGTYRGGYVPVEYDYNASRKTINPDERTKLDDAKESGTSRGFWPQSTNRFTKTRTNFVDIVKLDVSRIPRLMDTVLRFTHMNPAVADVNKLLADPEINKLLRSYDKHAIDQIIKPFLDRAVTQKYTNSDAGTTPLDPLVRFIKNNAGFFLMFGNVTNSLLAAGSIPLMFSKITKPKYALKGIGHVIYEREAHMKDVHNMSVFMKNRHDKQMARMLMDIDIVSNPRKHKISKIGDWLGANTYFLQQAIQIPIDLATWQGRYDQSIDEGVKKGIDDRLNHERAIADADSAVRASFVGFSPEDQSAFESRGEFFRAANMFLSFFNNWANLLGEKGRIAVRDMVGGQKYASLFFTTMVLGFAVNTLSEGINLALKGQLPEDEEDDGLMDDYLSELLFIQLRGASGFFGFAGNAMQAIYGERTAARYDDYMNLGAAFSVGFSTLQESSGVLWEWYDYLAEGEEVEIADQIRTVGDAITFFTKVPVRLVTERAALQLEVEEGELEPTGALDYTRMMITGKPSREARE